MWNFLKNLFKSDKQFRREHLETVSSLDKQCEEMLVLAATIADEEEKTKLIAAVRHLQQDSLNLRKTLE